MGKFMNINDYIQSWEETFRPFFNRYVLIEIYYNQLVKKVNQLIEDVSPETFWEVFPELLGIDARLALLNELVELLPDEDLALEPGDLINWIEKDYKFYTKELCGYKLNSKTNCSIIFQVS